MFLSVNGREQLIGLIGHMIAISVRIHIIILWLLKTFDIILLVLMEECSGFIDWRL